MKKIYIKPAVHLILCDEVSLLNFSLQSVKEENAAPDIEEDIMGDGLYELDVDNNANIDEDDI